jgi:hypothetical protein
MPRTARGAIVRTMLKRTCTALLAAAVAAVAAAPASAAKTPTFTAKLTATFETSWNMPSYVTGESCFRRNISYGFGEESWTIESRGTSRVTAALVGVPGRKTVRLDGHVKARGAHSRSGGNRVRWEPGKCGGDAGVLERKDDCGTRMPEYKVGLNADGGKVTLNPLHADHMAREKLTFDDCYLSVADGLTEDVFPTMTDKLSKDAIYGSQRTLTLKGNQKWHQVFYPGRGGETTTASKLKWSSS